MEEDRPGPHTVRPDLDDGQQDEALPILSDRLNVAHFVPSEALAPYITRIYHFRSNSIHVQDMQPAALGQLTFLLEGNGHLTFADGHIDPVHPATLFGPGNAAVQFTFAGPLEHFGVAFSPMGFVAMTGSAANAYVDRAAPAVECFGPEIDALAADFLERRRSKQLRSSYMIEQLSEFLLARIRPIPASHKLLIDKVLIWISSDLDPDVETLYKQLPMSRSTASRLITRYFASAPKLLMRKYRALRAAMMLLDPDTPKEKRVEVESLFYDQPHMIREFRQFTGRTPGALEGRDAEILRLWLRKDNNHLPPPYPG